MLGRLPLSLVLLCMTLCNAESKPEFQGGDERFYEELALRPLIDGKVSASFQFVTELRGAKLRDPAIVDEECKCLHVHSS
jgi:hypothetical protein